MAIAYPRGVPLQTGDGAEVVAEVAVPDHAGRLVLDAFVNDTRLEKRYPGFRFMRLWANDRLIWEEDIARRERERSGFRWMTESAGVDSRLRLRFCVVDKRGVGDHLSVAFLGAGPFAGD
ncbi:MAG: hypothetical protein M5U29_04700 [Anaerolineae bacterium]|nr:hypothetical protein [Anaerolineae bacterium]